MPRRTCTLRDATINDYLWPLEQVGGFMVYKQGQAAMRLLSERYGPDKLVRFWWQVGEMRSVRAALGKVYGLKLEDFNKLYRKEMRAALLAALRGPGGCGGHRPALDRPPERRRRSGFRCRP